MRTTIWLSQKLTRIVAVSGHRLNPAQSRTTGVAIQHSRQGGCAARREDELIVDVVVAAVPLEECRRIVVQQQGLASTDPQQRFSSSRHVGLNCSMARQWGLQQHAHKMDAP